MRPIRAAAVLLLVTLAACGSSASDEAKSAVQKYLTGWAKRDGKTVCSMMTATTRAQFVSLVSRTTATTDCAKAVVRLPRSVSLAFKAAKVKDVKVSHDEAIATVKAGPRESPLIVQKQNGKWLVASGAGTQ